MKRTEYYREKMANAMKQYQDVAGYFRTHKLVVTNVFFDYRSTKTVTLFCNISTCVPSESMEQDGNHCCITGNDFRCGGYASVTPGGGMNQ